MTLPPRGIADTSVFIARESGHPLRTLALPATLAISWVTIAELRAGVLVAGDPEARERRLTTLTEAMTLEPLVLDGAVARAWARLRLRLRHEGLRMPVNDSWIAATAMAHGVPVVTQDDDYSGIPGLDVVVV